ncbi:phospholipase A and acyltransferase 3-like [Sorex araneus]|uniref:phospholipase A and acyltransferase 3-like n=1 Tax=Sorex araneus TaxID=42254 RepID=UPI00243400BC|nr:phospholipase A and acyltransferase 3-like [Sorex araneus]
MASSRFHPEPKPGDLIEFFRSGKLNSPGLEYQHWAVYVGNGYVVHVTSPDIDIRDVESVVAASSQGIRAEVKKELLLEVAAGSNFRVNNKYDGELRARPAEQIVQRALALVGQKRSYNLIYQNCEHFATELRHGVARSDQVEKKKDAFLKLLGIKDDHARGALFRS